ncbi:MAG: HPr(Ser) kinase/phosphatase [Oscillospiraceae bacterium]|nr:HPr(Ser) kinase/phosphatase [Oscillospiraceae bacterium]
MAASKYTVKLKQVAEELGLTVLHASTNYETAVLCTYDVNRPAMQLTGFYDYFDPKRLQITGLLEAEYIKTLSPEQRHETLERFMQHDIVGLVFCHGTHPTQELMELAEKYDRNIFLTAEDTSEFQGNVIISLRSHLAPRITMHGVLVEVHGEGVLITGDSGIGKSEAALELVKRGHRLIADDAVEIRKINKDRLLGSAPEMIRYYMELRGIGIINVRHIYGAGAVKPEGLIDMVVSLEPWVAGKMYDRLGVIEEYENILGIKLPKVTVPVRPGRNLAVIMELAAMNNRQKNMGYNAAAMLEAEHDAAIDAGLF